MSRNINSLRSAASPDVDPNRQNVGKWIGYYGVNSGATQGTAVFNSAPAGDEGALAGQSNNGNGGNAAATGFFDYALLQDLVAQIGTIVPAAYPSFAVYPGSGSQTAGVFFNYDRQVGGDAFTGVVIRPSSTYLQAFGKQVAAPKLAYNEWHLVSIVVDSCAATAQLVIDGFVYANTTPGVSGYYPPRALLTVYLGDPTATAAPAANFFCDAVSFNTVDGCPLSGGTGGTGGTGSATGSTGPTGPAGPPGSGGGPPSGTFVFCPSPTPAGFTAIGRVTLKVRGDDRRERRRDDDDDDGDKRVFQLCVAR